VGCGLRRGRSGRDRPALTRHPSLFLSVSLFLFLPLPSPFPAPSLSLLPLSLPPPPLSARADQALGAGAQDGDGLAGEVEHPVAVRLGGGGRGSVGEGRSGGRDSDAAARRSLARDRQAEVRDTLRRAVRRRRADTGEWRRREEGVGVGLAMARGVKNQRGQEGAEAMQGGATLEGGAGLCKGGARAVQGDAGRANLGRGPPAHPHQYPGPVPARRRRPPLPRQRRLQGSI
jgi:hypothetical protein